MSEEESKGGAFVASLKRNNSKIRADRAEAITEDAELVYKHTIEQMEARLRKMIRDRDNMLDLSPTDAKSLVLASDFDETAFVQKDIELGVKIRNEEIKLKVAKDSFKHLFGA